MMFADRCFDATTGDLVFDTFNTNGILGDEFLVNGVVQPVLHVSPRRYRFRWTNTGPSRFLQVYLTDLNALTTAHPFWQISNDGNLCPSRFRFRQSRWASRRADVIIDFSSMRARRCILRIACSSRTARAAQQDRFQPQARASLCCRSWWINLLLPTTAPIRQRSPASIRCRV